MKKLLHSNAIRWSFGLIMITLTQLISAQDHHVPANIERPTQQCISDEHRAEIKKILEENRKKFGIKKRSSEDIYLEWPVRQGANYDENHSIGISNYLDQNSAFPDQLLDWNCGQRTYDLSGGYNHSGIDIFSWPFQWKKQDEEHLEIVAAAPGTIIYKYQQSYDKNCTSSNDNWNAVYVEHVDGSVAWYGHMKQNSLTKKEVGESVELGEFLGMMGSSGFSNGSHLHFELYDAQDNLIDPYDGPCNSTTDRSWWVDQPEYFEPHLSQIYTHSSAPVIGCHDVESLGIENNFQHGEEVIFSRYFRDQMNGTTSFQTILDPFGQTWASWSSTSEFYYTASYWWNSAILPSSGGEGEWTYRVEYEGETIEQKFYLYSGGTDDVIGLSTSDLIIEDVDPGMEGTASFVITNSGSDGALIHSIDYPAGFSGGWHGFLDAGESKTIYVTFRPENTGALSGTISINTAADGQTQLNVTGYSKEEQTIEFEEIGAVAIGESVEIEAWSSSGLGLTFEKVSGPIDVDGNVVTGTGVGSGVVMAIQVGDDYYKYVEVTMDVEVYEPVVNDHETCDVAATAILGINNTPVTPHWFEFTAPATDDYLISSLGFTDNDTYLEVYSSCMTGTTDYYESDDYFGDQSALVLSLNQGDEIKIQWSAESISGFDWALNQGSFTPGIYCESAVPASLGTNSVPATGYDFFLFSYTMQGTNKLVVSSETDYETIIIENFCQDGTDGGDDDFDDLGDGYGNATATTLIEGDEVIIVWDTENGGNFDWSLSEIALGPGDNCDLAVEASIGSNSSPSAQYWYTFTAPSTDYYDFSSVGTTTADTYVGIYSNCLTDTAIEETSDYYDAELDEYFDQARVVLELEQSETVKIYWDAGTNTSGFNWSLTTLPENPGDVCTMAVQAATGLNQVPSTLRNEYWFIYSMPSDGWLDFGTEEWWVDLGDLQLYTECGGTLENPDGLGNEFFYAGTNVLIKVDTREYDDYQLNIIHTPLSSGQACQLAVTASLGANTTTGVNDQFGSWYKFTMPSTGNLEITSDTDIGIGLYSQCSSGNSYPLEGFGLGNTTEATLQQGDVVYIAWDTHFNGTTFNWNIAVESFENGDVCTLPIAATTGTNVVAETINSVLWYEYTMPQDGRFSIDYPDFAESPFFVQQNLCTYQEDLQIGFEARSTQEFYERIGLVQGDMIRMKIWPNGGDFTFTTAVSDNQPGDLCTLPSIIANAGTNTVPSTSIYDYYTSYTMPRDGILELYFPEETHPEVSINGCTIFDEVAGDFEEDAEIVGYVSHPLFISEGDDYFIMAASQGDEIIMGWETPDDPVGNPFSEEFDFQIVISDPSPTPDLEVLPTITSECPLETITPPTATDDSGNTVTGVLDGDYPVAETGVIRWIYDDGNGRVSSQTQEVVIDDITPPTPDVANLPNVIAQCIVTELAEPSATDNCGGNVTAFHTVDLPITISTTITWTYVDEQGNTTTQDQEIIVEDTTPPTPTVQDLPDLVSDCSIEEIDPPGSTDNCGGPTSLITTFQVPLTESQIITWTYVDESGNETSQDQNVIIGHDTPPTPNVSSLSTLSDACSIQSLEAPQATSLCGELLTGITDIELPITSSTTIQWAFEDRFGNVTTQDQIVSISDEVAPVPDVEALDDLTDDCIIETLTAPTATDNCGEVTVTNNVTLPITGSTTIVWTFEDINGNTATQSQNVIINDVTAPVPDSENLSQVSSECAISSLEIPSATDNCGGEVTVSNDASFPIESSTLVTWSYEDGSGNIATQTQSVVVNDVTAPVPDESILSDISAQCSVENLQIPSATDNCSGEVLVTNNVTLPVDVTTVIIWTYEDSNGNKSTQEQNIIIEDNTGPEPDAAVLDDVIAECSAVSLTAPTASDNCGGNVTVTNNATFPITTTRVVTWTYEDEDGNITTQDQNVVIVDTTPPVPDDTTLDAVNAECSVSSLPTPTGTDNCGGTVTVTNNVTFPITATTMVIWTYSDDDGNSQTRTQEVIIEDVTPPVPDAADLSEVNSECAVASLTTPTATDACGGFVTVTNDVSFPINTSTVVTWTYTDENDNTITQTQNVVIDDVSGPEPDVATLSEIVGQCSVASLTAPVATDNCDGAVTGTTEVSLPITANTTITWTYVDSEGNTTTQNQNVIIDDTTSPTPDASSLENVTAQCSVESLEEPTATDNCGGLVTVSNNASLPITESTSVTWTYSDEDGNTTTQNQEVIIDDTTAPDPDASALLTITGICVIESLDEPSATDNCSGTVVVSNDATFPITSNTTVTWTYTDESGNSSTQNQTIVLTGPDVALDVAVEITDVVAGNDGVADVTVTGGTAPYSYDWSNGSTSEDLTNVPGGVYDLTVTDANGCTITIQVTVGDIILASNPGQEVLSIYPNPVRSMLNLETSLDRPTEIEVTVMDLSGRTVHFVRFPASRNSVRQLDISSIQPGMYLLHASWEDHQIIKRISITD